jgi:hypothetical protein
VLAPQNETKLAAGFLNSFENGKLSGELNMDGALAGHDTVTVEVFAHGIMAASGEVRIADRGAEGPVPFSIAIKRFPRVSLPCTISARVVETDTALKCNLAVETLDFLWEALLPFRARVTQIRRGQVLLEASGEILHPDTEVFELREAGELVGLSEPEGTTAGNNTLFIIPLSERLLDGNEHKLFIMHRGSNLPVNTQPLSVALNLEVEPQPSVGDLIGRIESVERQLRERYAEAFNGLALNLYRHIDNVTLKQRSNFEREISALRRILGGAGKGPDTDTGPDTGPDTGQTAPAKVTLAFEADITGYGIGDLRTTNTGKTFRYGAPRCGFLLPVCASGAARLVVQGIRRSHDGALVDSVLFVNGVRVDMQAYSNPQSESWNITANLSEGVLRDDRNLIELRLPNGNPPDALAEAETSVGILEVTLEKQAEQADDADIDDTTP